MKKVSVIVPVYNVETYLQQTLDSVAAQTYSALEVILIDDGSTDGSGEICKAQAARDSRFHYYRTENAGPSAARNTGLAYATGQYVGFCDGDDLLDPDMYATMVDRIEQESADIVLCDIYSERDGCKFGFPWKDATVLQREILMGAMVGNLTDNDIGIPIWGSVVRCLFRAEIIANNQVRFPEDIHFAEDLVFTLRYLRSAEKAVICDKDFYWYRCTPSSLMHSFFAYKKGMFQARKRLLADIRDAISGCSNQEELQKRLAVTARCYFHECIGNACRPAEGRTEADKKQELKEILFDREVVAAFENYDARNRKMRLLYMLIKNKMAFAIKRYYTYRFGRR